MIFEAVALFLVALTGRPRLSLWIEGVVFWLFAIANTLVYSFRGSYIMIWDFIAIPTAMNVASNYSYRLTGRAIFWSVAFLALFVLIWFCRSDVKRFLNTLWKRAAVAVAAVIFLVSLTKLVQMEPVKEFLDINDSRFSIERVTEENGMMLGFLYKMKYMSVYVPGDYSAAEEAGVIEDTKVEGGEKLPADFVYPDIVVVMNEAMSDLAVDCPIETNEDYLPFIHSLQEGAENTITGYMNASVLGGKTPNTEFEFLTGNTMAFLPEDSIAFQQFVKREIDAMPRHLGTLGYESVAMHPYDSSGWDRTMAYPLLGFGRCHFKDYFDLSQENLIRDYMSDSAFFRKIEEEVADLGKDGKPVFSFNVTMQNHSGYGGSVTGAKKLIKVKNAQNSDPDALQKLENYLTLMRLSDDAFREMVEYYKGVDRPTILVTFGDHQPATNILSPMFPEGESLDEEGRADNYRVPFVIWANYDIEEGQGIETSANYLGNLVLKAAGIPLSRYRTRIDEFSQKYPVLTAVRSVDDKGVTKQMDGRDPVYEDYVKLQYYELFDDSDQYP
ncbi:MAG: LTA synthase family protein [Lachnospiraceae bacterium]|nr:LTA synthase family protein [Lachnospiraceae bacterium]